MKNHALVNVFIQQRSNSNIATWILSNVQSVATTAQSHSSAYCLTGQNDQMSQIGMIDGLKHHLLETYNSVNKPDSHRAIILWWPKGSAHGPAQYHTSLVMSINSFSLLIRQWYSQIYLKYTVLSSRVFCIWGVHNKCTQCKHFSITTDYQ